MILSKSLHKDMYSLKASGLSIKDINPPNPDPLAESRYSCMYWIDHLCDSKPKSWSEGVRNDQVTAITVFLQKKYLYWLEGLSLCKSVGRGVISIKRLWSLVQVSCIGSECPCSMIEMLMLAEYGRPG